MRPRRLLSVLGWLYVGLFVSFLLLPIVIMVPASFSASESLEFPPQSLSLRWYEEVLGDSRWLNSGWLSLKLALFAAFVATVAGLMVGIAHMRFGAVGAGLRAFLMFPMVAPHIVLATGLFSILLQMRSLGDPLVLGLMHACLGVPLTMVVFVNAVEAIDPLLWTAASSLGARWWTIMRQIILPNLGIATVVAFLLAFVTSWDEVTLAVFIGPAGTPTLPSRMFSYLQELINPSLTAIATLLVAVTVVLGLIVIALPRLRRRTS